ncbi:MAG: lipid IV(A) 3-deoxy-D-manno-octulosonic acid transferase [Pseudomonadota bacterium]
MARSFYTALIYLLLPLAYLRLRWRARKEPGYGQHIGERFGRYEFTPSKPIVWIHAVSVGETRAAAPLVAALKARYPDHQILVTHMTPTARVTTESLFGDSVLCCYLPYDAPFAMQRFLTHFQPSLGVVMETEIWPNLIAAAYKKGIPLWLVNARLSEKSARLYARFPSLTAGSLAKFSGICAQTSSDATRLTQLGGQHVRTCGNVKFDITPPEKMLELGIVLRERFGKHRPVFLAGSTREDEEELILDAIEKMHVDDLVTIIVPRHPQRFDTVATLIQKRGFKLQRRSAGELIDQTTQIVLGDSMGEMFAYYAACDVAFIGGSLLPLGGQNLIEACAVGKPVLIGPHTFNFLEATEQAVAGGAARRVTDVEMLASAVTDLLKNKAMQQKMGMAGLAFSQAHRGAVERIISIITAHQ